MKTFVVLTVYGAEPLTDVLGELKVSVEIDPPYVQFGNLLRETTRMRDALKELWEGHYGTDIMAWPATPVWQLQVESTVEGREPFRQTLQETLPLDFTTLLFAKLHQGLIDAAAHFA